MRAERSHLSHDLGLGGVDAHDEALLHEARHDGDDAASLLLKRYAGFIEPRPCGLSPDIDDVCTVIAHASRPGDGILKAVVSAAVRKRVGRHIEDAHDERVKAVCLEDL